MNIRIGYLVPEFPDPALRATMGSAARQTALKRFDYRRNAALLAQAVRQAGSAVQART